MEQKAKKYDCINFSENALRGGLMKQLVKRSFVAVTALSLMTAGLMLGGCGGSGGGASKQVVSGTAAVGDPLAGQVTLKDSSSPVQETTVNTDQDGFYAVDVTDKKAPFILEANGKDSAGTNHTLHSFAEGTGTTNINPLSDAIVASASESSDPDDDYKHPDATKLKKMKDRMQDSVKNLLEKIRPLLKRYSADGKDPIKDECKADHHGMDSVFDNIIITIKDGLLTITNKKGVLLFSASVKDILSGHYTGTDDDLPLPTDALAAPANLAALGGTGQVTLSWNAVDKATSYNVYYATSTGVTVANGTKIANTTTSYVQTGLAAGTAYYYIVAAVNSTGEGAASAQATATTTTTQPVPVVPAAPAGVIATGGTNQVTLKWDAVTNATSYSIYYSTSTGVTKANGTKITPATSPAVLGSLTAGTTYYYIVAATNSVGEGAASIQAAATTLTAVPSPVIPAVPTTVTAVGGATQATISWPAVTGAASYNLYWSTTTGVTKTSGTKVAAVTSPYIKTGLAAGTTYYFIVSASNSVGESAASAQVTATTNAATVVAPAAPTGVKAIGGAKQVSISWAAVSGATSYNVYSATATGVTKANGAKTVSAANPYLQTGLLEGTTYYYIVTALNSAGEGVASAQVSAPTDAAVVTPPPACGTCHAIPPALGAHAKHKSAGYDCNTCHGTGYSSTTVNAATHANGVKNVTIGIWDATTRTCATQCHGSRSW